MSKLVEIYEGEAKKAVYLFSDSFRKLEKVVYLSDDFVLSTKQQVMLFLESRLIDSGRPARHKMLGIPQGTRLTWYQEIGRTFGFDADDYFWVRIPSQIPKDRKNWQLIDFHWKLNNCQRGVYYG